MPRLLWRPLLLWTLLGVAASVVLVLGNLAQTEDQLGALVDTSTEDVAAPIFAAELGPTAMRAGGAHDGHYFYLIARAPMHAEASTPYLDRPGYRLGRPLFPWLAWSLHPTGGGWGLVGAMFAVGVAGLIIGGLGTGALSLTLGGGAWPAAVFPVAFGSMLSLRISVPDQLATALAICAIAALYRRRLLFAAVLAVAAVLTKESVLLIFVGALIARRDRPSLMLVGASGLAFVGWQGWLRWTLPDFGLPNDEVGVPFNGLLQAVRLWSDGIEPVGALVLVATIAFVGYVLVRRGLRHPLAWIVVSQLAFLSLLSPSVLTPERNVSRVLIPVTALAAVMLATPAGAAVARRIEQAREASTSAVPA